MLSRLRGHDAVAYRAAIAECMACWVLAGKLGMPVSSKPSGRNQKVLDWLAEHTPARQSLHVEVKAPFVEAPEDAWSGSDAPVLVGCMRRANDQFEAGRVNVLIVVPELRTPVYAEREQLVEAFIGQPMITWSVDRKTGGSIGDTRNIFRPDGALVARHRWPAGFSPRFTRLSAVVTIEEFLAEKVHDGAVTAEELADAQRRGDPSVAHRIIHEYFSRSLRPDHAEWIEHHVFVLHNPFAQNPLDEAIFARYPQLVVRGPHMVWTDGYINR